MKDGIIIQPIGKSKRSSRKKWRALGLFLTDCYKLILKAIRKYIVRVKREGFYRAEFIKSIVQYISSGKGNNKAVDYYKC